MKQKITIKVDMHCDDCRHKAMRIAAAACGVTSVALDDSKDKMVVVGEDVDTTCLTNILRKKVGYAILEKIEEDKKKEDEKKDEEECIVVGCPPGCYCIICIKKKAEEKKKESEDGKNGKDDKKTPIHVRYIYPPGCPPGFPTEYPPPGCPPGCRCIICVSKIQCPQPQPLTPQVICPYNRCPRGYCNCYVQVAVNDSPSPCSVM
ncbi:PREDICTED: protein PYRICULARIA ORYZAE RESISTANCE 21-like [Nelumbo nucifera]|uniref:Protein PYRICULARIA ORYZAE RESISTANCE 21-like n=2 Tax=Nelumbo nucifera TaxID=4432 RepID=A0A1U8AG96_NELNU|nr:PREDICTED: protein PYRICULARIA ORYZAE RESISTANCE 21-like [Nelumbo nucifera]DAD40083.1 TPA_asm: hypothetical protein HUJ06_014406 [Nelumbo nucifera]